MERSDRKVLAVPVLVDLRSRFHALRQTPVLLLTGQPSKRAQRVAALLLLLLIRRRIGRNRIRRRRRRLQSSMVAQVL